MKIAALTTSVLLFAFAACSTTSSSESVDTTYGKPNSIVTSEIESRVAEIPFQHRDELLENLLWLAETGEPAIPSLLKGMENSEPKVRSSCAWVLGRIGDRRVISDLRNHASDSTEAVRLEVCRTLVLLGDLQQAPTLIEGLDSDRREVRYMCHEALKTATGRDFGYDHLTLDVSNRRTAVLSWRKWWSDYSGDSFFASNYADRHQLNENAVPAAPMGETSTVGNPGNTSSWNSHNLTMEEGSGSTSPESTTSSTGTGLEDPVNTTRNNTTRTTTGSTNSSTNGSSSSGASTTESATNGSSGTGSSNNSGTTTGSSSTGSSPTGNATSTATGKTRNTSSPSGTNTANSTSNTETTSTTGTTNNSNNPSTTGTTNTTNGSSTTNSSSGSSTGSTNGSNSTSGTTNTGSTSTNPSTGSGNGSTGTTGSGTNQTTRQG